MNTGFEYKRWFIIATYVYNKVQTSLIETPILYLKITHSSCIRALLQQKRMSFSPFCSMLMYIYGTSEFRLVTRYICYSHVYEVAPIIALLNFLVWFYGAVFVVISVCRVILLNQRYLSMNMCVVIVNSQKTSLKFLSCIPLFLGLPVHTT